MGDGMKEDDLHIESMFDAMNHRFAPPQRAERGGEPDEDYHGGVAELAELQKEFGIFKEGRPLSRSFQVLGMGGLRNARARNRWFRVLRWLARTNSPMSGVSGDDAIVKTIIANLDSGNPKPIHFTSHSDQTDPPSVRINDAAQPFHYMDQEYITISIPLRPRTQ